MPRLSTWFVRASLIYLAAGFSLGAILLANKALGFYAQVWNLLPIHIEILLMGWLLQLAAGVAFWILPRLSGRQPRGNEQWAWFAFWLFNLGIVLVIVEATTHVPGLSFTGRLAELGGAILFVVSAWKRIKSFGT